MLLSDWRVLVRRWYIVVGGVLTTIFVCWVASVLVPAQFQVSSSFLLLPPPAIVDGKPTNPYLNLGGLEGVSDVMSTAMLDNSVGKALSQAGLNATYQISRDFNVAGPVLNLEVTAATPDMAIKAQTFLLDRVPVTLDSLQAAVNVSERSRVTSTVITKDVAAKTSRKSQLRLLLVAGFLGLGLTYLTAAFLDGFILSRQKPAAGAARPLAQRSAPPTPVAGQSWRS